MHLGWIDLAALALLLCKRDDRIGLCILVWAIQACQVPLVSTTVVCVRDNGLQTSFWSVMAESE